MEFDPSTRTPYEILDEFARDKDKTDIDIISFVKELGIDDHDFQEKRRKEWTGKEKLKNVSEYYDTMKDRYEDIMMKLHRAEEIEAPRKEGDWFRKKYTKAPGSRGASKYQLEDMKRADTRDDVVEEEEEKVDLTTWQKIGKHFRDNADARDKLFNYIGAMGESLVRPKQPGEEGQGLVARISEGISRGEKSIQDEQAAAAKYALDMSTARQKVNPLQYWSSAMKEAAAMLPEDIDPNSAAGRKWIANHLRQQGIPSAAVDIGAAIESFNLKMLQTTDEKEKERIQKLINEQYSILESLLSGSVGGSSVTNTVPYLGA